ncbi:MAG: oligosaccharide flippase family protein [Dysgonamonadaceae bacterium]|jgi:O-antigen/teichoic acid export membrane protein|nr:oligosaccharide flippase family protein [Dysgonamonadaceae bacterium]
MTTVRSLAKDSAIYGGSTILVKMMSWLMNMVFTRVLLPEDYGVMTNLYAYLAVLAIILTFGMETGLFRFISQKDKYKAENVYSTVLTIVGIIVAAFMVIFLVFLDGIRPWLWEKDVPDNCIRLVIIILGIDAFSAIPFAYLRYKKRAVKFGFLKILNIIVYTVSCIFLMIICPWIDKHNPGIISWFWKSDSMLIYVFIANLAGTVVQTVFLLPELFGFRFSFDKTLARKMLSYCFPLVIMGLAGMSNQVVDKLIFPAVYQGEDWKSELGIYSGCFKIALVMMIFTQAFRYAYEPFVFEKKSDRDSKQSYADVMKYFIMFGLLVFLGVMFYIDIFKYFVGNNYWSALKVVPIVLMGELFFAVYFNLSIWYKLNDKTWWGTVFSIIGFAIVITLNVVYIPKAGYIACAWASFAGNLLIMILSYFIGQKYYPVRYDLKSIGFYTVTALILYTISCFMSPENIYLRLIINTILIAVYIFTVIKRDLPVNNIPFMKRLFNR